MTPRERWRERRFLFRRAKANTREGYPDYALADLRRALAIPRPLTGSTGYVSAPQWRGLAWVV